jgi:DUF1680 family protein
MNDLNPFSFHHWPEQAYTHFYLGDIAPDGWLRQQIERDLLDGFIGCLDQLAPDVLVRDDIYGKDQRTSINKDAGTRVSPNALSWWNSESQGNWWDGFIRSALLIGDEAALKKVHRFIDEKLAHQEPDGYLGMYAPDMRHQKDGENADFWAQTTLFRGLLAYYEKTREAPVLSAVERAVQRSMKAYPPNRSSPFKELADGHSLAITDVLDQLHRLTGNTTYLKYALFLYENYNSHRDDDLQVKHLLNKRYKFQKHGVHVYELFRSLITAYYASGNPHLDKAIRGYLSKLSRVITPSGGPIGDEWVEGRMADASETGYEYCSIHELFDSYAHLLQKSGNLRLADRMEWLFYNAGQGARHPNGQGIAYLKTDNSFAMTGPLHPGEDPDPKHPQTRYKYSPVHQDVAVCCAPNAGRIYPYFIRSMWVRTNRGILACLFGPCRLTTVINGVAVSVRQITRYPFDHRIKMTVDPEVPVRFELAFRIPAWTEDIRVNGHRIKTGRKHQHAITRKWQRGDILEIDMTPRIRWHADLKEGAYISHGPLLFAYPIKARERIARTHLMEGFYDLHYLPVEKTRFSIPKHPQFKAIPGTYQDDHPWESWHLSGQLVDQKTGNATEVTLVPMGGTILRQVTFPKT